MNKKNTIRLTEFDLKRVISESVKEILKENEQYSGGHDFHFSFVKELGYDAARWVYRYAQSKTDIPSSQMLDLLRTEEGINVITSSFKETLIEIANN